MKKTKYKDSDLLTARLLWFTSIGLTTLLLLSMMLGAAIAQQDDQGDVVAIVLRINGALDYRENATSDWKQAKAKQALYDGYQIKTETGNKAVIHYASSGSRVLVNENTELEVQAVRAAAGQRPSTERTRLMIGEVFSRVKSGSNYDVETPTSVASVRGTEFNSSFSEDGEATFLVIDESVVEVMNQLGSVLLSQRQTISVSEGDTPSDDEVTTLTEDEADTAVDWVEEVEPSWKLNITPEGGDTHEMGQQFALTIWAEDKESGSIDGNATFALTSFSASSEVLEFSSDDGRTWTNAPNVTIMDGQARVMCRAVSEGSCAVSIEAENAEPASMSISVKETKNKIEVQMNFTEEDGTGEETLILELEEK
ncbi:FecR domain-containing protein [Candidatus Omnitrophota bacterium]